MLIAKNAVFKSVIQLSVKCSTKKKRLKMMFGKIDISYVVKFVR